MKLEELVNGVRLTGVVPGDVVEVIFSQKHGADAVEVTYKTLGGAIDQCILFRSDEEALLPATSGSRSFDASATDFKTVAEAQRVKLGGLFDPMLAVATSDVQPLPHQIRAVYGELLPRTPLRFLLADDPGAGKTIMAGLFIKELILREDVDRALVVAPGGLVEQWQDELFFKFGLDFEILTPQGIEASVGPNIFEKHPLLIARMDQLARNEELQQQLAESRWDLTVVDEAHRMSAHHFGSKLEKSKRFQLGEVLGEISRHFLLMTATPHSGKEEDFQLFLSLLDKERFAGKNRVAVDVDDVMRRMIKEDLLTFEGRKLFPERIAESIPYELTHQESELYELVSDYVRNGMNRAARLDGRRRNTVGFALTVLQRRLASSPEAIYRSLVRRAGRLRLTKTALENGSFVDERRTSQDSVLVDSIDGDELSSEAIEEFEDSIVDAATAAATIAELDAEITELNDLAAVARKVRDRGEDKKWSELSHILRDNVIARDASGKPRKLIVFTEHRDTLEYLAWRIKELIGKPEAVVSIHGGVRRNERRAITAEFTSNPGCQIMLATDAAGEGLNLQAAHLMVNYDLPWNPNRIEQRFGRIHRIGQSEVCRLWNLVAANTREGEVFATLLNKIDEQRRAYGGKVFDVLGAAFTETPLRDLLIEAIRYGDLPETRARMHEVIDRSVSEGLTDLLNDQALAGEHLTASDLSDLRGAMQEARARRLQPHYIGLAFREAFTRWGGRIVRREKGRFEITHVPAVLRNGHYGYVASRYDRVTFDLEHVRAEGQSRADLLAPGHPLHDAVMDHTVISLASVLNRGTVVASGAITSPQLLVGVLEEIVDATGHSVAKRFGYAYVREDGSVVDAGPAPYLDCFPVPDVPAVQDAKALPWLQDAERRAVSWIVENRLPNYLAEVRPSRAAELAKQRTLVRSRLEHEAERLSQEAIAVAQKERYGDRPRESSENLRRKADEIRVRLGKRLALIDRQAQMASKPPQVVSAALLLPVDMVRSELRDVIPNSDGLSSDARGLDLVLAQERALGRTPRTSGGKSPGYDIVSIDPGSGQPVHITVKTRPVESEGFWVTHNEVMTAKNAAPHHRLALVATHSGGSALDEIRYLEDPFGGLDINDFEVCGARVDWAKTWARGRAPF